MKSSIRWSLVVGLGLWSISPSAFAEETRFSKLIYVAPESLFAPPGFDDNDRAEIFIAGKYPNTCFKQGPTVTLVNEEKHYIMINAQAYHYTSCWCLQALVPYTDKVDLGILKAGKYSLYVRDTEGETISAGDLTIAAARTNQPDDLLYASVSQIFVAPDGAGRATLMLSGHLPGSCATLQEVRVLYRSRGIVEVLPIVSVKTRPNCNGAPVAFTQSVSLAPPARGNTLVYVRSLNGASLSQIAEF